MPDVAKTDSPEQLLGLLREQRDLYRSLQQLSERQRRLISGDRPELLLNILRDRQTLVTKLARVNEQLSPYRSQWEEIYGGLPAAQHEEASKLLAEINRMLELILKADQEDQALLSARKQAVASAISDVRGGQAANAAYGRNINRSGLGGADITG